MDLNLQIVSSSMFWLAGILAVVSCLLAVQGPDWLRALVLRARGYARGSWNGGRFEGMGRLRWAATGISTLLMVVWAGPLFGLLASIFGLGALAVFLFYRRARQHLRYQQQAFQFLQSLDGLQATGLAYPAALWKLSQQLPTTFAERVRRRLQGYQKGDSLTGCFDEFLGEFPPGALRIVFQLLESTQKRGLGSRAIFERALPIVARELQLQQETLTLECQTALQIAITALLPWLLNGFLWTMQPEVFAQVGERPVLALGVLGGAIAWELAGAWWLRRLARYP